MTPIKLFCSDLDGTLLGNPEATRRFSETWSGLSVSERPLLCYNSGRLVDNILQLIEDEPLPQPDFVVGGVGSQLYDGTRNRAIAEFDKELRVGWDLAKVEQILSGFPGVTRQPPECLNPYKSSWYLYDAPDVANAIRRHLADAGLDVTIIYSSNCDLDVLPARAGKGGALRWLCRRIGISLNDVLVAGDSGNDTDMFLLPEVRGIVVRNAHAELHEFVARARTNFATRLFADGVLEGMAHFDLI